MVAEPLVHGSQALSRENVNPSCHQWKGHQDVSLLFRPSSFQNVFLKLFVKRLQTSANIKSNKMNVMRYLSDASTTLTFRCAA